MITSLGQIHVSVTDLDRSVAFYRDVLGLEFLFRVPGQSMAFFRLGGTRLYIGAPESPEFRSKLVAYLTTDDLVAEHARLTAAGVAFLDEPHVVHRDETGELWMAFFQDPDGHQLALMEQRPPG